MRRLATWLIVVLGACGSHGSSPPAPDPPPPHEAPPGPPPPEPTVVAKADYPLELAVAGGRLWFVASDRAVHVVDAGTDRVVKQFGWVFSLSADGDGAWVVADDQLGDDRGALWHLPIAGAPQRFLEGVCWAAVVGDGRLVIARKATTSVRDADGTEHVLAPGAAGHGGTVANGQLYTTTQQGEVTAFPLDGWPGRRIGSLGISIVEGFEVDEAFAYGSGDGRVVALPLAGGPARVLATGLDDPRELAPDGAGGVYVMTYGTHSDFWGHTTNHDGQLFHVPAAGTTQVLAEGFIGAGRLAVAPGTVYLSEVYGGKVVAVTR